MNIYKLVNQKLIIALIIISTILSIGLFNKINAYALKSTQATTTNISVNLSDEKLCETKNNIKDDKINDEVKDSLLDTILNFFINLFDCLVDLIKTFLVKLNIINI